MPEKKQRFIRISLLLLSAAFIAFGIYRGEMDADPLHNLCSVECIRCGKCVAGYPTKAISLGFKTECHSDDTPHT